MILQKGMWVAKGGTRIGESDHEDRAQAFLNKSGVPSSNFIRKVYNILIHKHDQLESIKDIEQRLIEHYNGDFNLAYSQCQSGNWTLISKEDLDELSSKQQVIQSIEEHMTIFNMYKKFHKN